MPGKKEIVYKPITNLVWRTGEVYSHTPLRFNRSGKFPEAGVDEAGMSCLAGPVCAAAVILPLGFYHPLIRDSKQLTEEQRDEAREIIVKNAVTYSVAFASVEVIDSINIYHARFKAMHEALDRLTVAPEFIHVDGNRFPPFQKIPFACCIKGDTKYLSIAAASIIAKTERDAFMRQLHSEFPYYQWCTNKGYGVPAHRRAIALHGPSKYHRCSFTLLRDSDIEKYAASEAAC